MSSDKLIPHLFRSEFSKIVAVLCKTFGLSSIQLAEDIASETFMKASETWGLKGVPENPRAWLYTVAKNKVKDYFRREHLYTEKILPEVLRSYSVNETIELDLSDDNIQDSQLRMLFTICNPEISIEGQLSFALRVLCGFGVEEISRALLTQKSTINKRIYRVKEQFRKKKLTLSFPTEEELPDRLDSILSVLYLLFNEGYYSSTSESSLKKGLCVESMRLLLMLLDYPPTNQSRSNALMALFCFHSSRFDARISDQEKLILYDDQDKSKWNQTLILKGERYLELSSKGEQMEKYHIESLIAFWHSRIEPNLSEKWNAILKLYNKLIQIDYSPVIALNRTYALAMANNKETALKEALKINLKDNHLYHSLLAFLYKGFDEDKRTAHLNLAMKLARTENDRETIKKKLEE